MIISLRCTAITLLLVCFADQMQARVNHDQSPNIMFDEGRQLWTHDKIGKWAGNAANKVKNTTSQAANWAKKKAARAARVVAEKAKRAAKIVADKARRAHDKAKKLAKKNAKRYKKKFEQEARKRANELKQVSQQLAHAVRNGAGPLIKKLEQKMKAIKDYGMKQGNKFARATMSTAQWMASETYAKAKLLNEASKAVIDEAADFAEDVKEFGEKVAKEMKKMAGIFGRWADEYIKKFINNFGCKLVMDILNGPEDFVDQAMDAGMTALIDQGLPEKAAELGREQADKAIDAGKKKAKRKLIQTFKKQFKKLFKKAGKKAFNAAAKKNPAMLVWLGGKLTVHHSCMLLSSSYKKHMIDTKWNSECEPFQNCALLIDQQLCVLWFPVQIAEEAVKIAQNPSRAKDLLFKQKDLCLNMATAIATFNTKKNNKRCNKKRPRRSKRGKSRRGKSKRGRSRRGKNNCKNQKENVDDRVDEEEVSGDKNQGYRGYQSFTRDDLACINWGEMGYGVRTYPDDGFDVDDHNFCRNPDSERETIWCFTGTNDHDWDWCDPLVEGETDSGKPMGSKSLVVGLLLAIFSIIAVIL